MNSSCALRQHGAEVMEQADVQLAHAPGGRRFPAGFYVTTNQQTFITLDGNEIEVRPAMMDCAVAVDRKKRAAPRAKKFHEVQRGMEIVVGHQGDQRCAGAAIHRAHGCFSIHVTRCSTRRNRRAASFARWRRNCKRAREEKGKIAGRGRPGGRADGRGPHLEKLDRVGLCRSPFRRERLRGCTTSSTRFSGLRWGLTRSAARWRSAATKITCARSIIIRACGEHFARGRDGGVLKSGIMARLRQARGRFRPGRLHSRRWPDAGSHDRHPRSAGCDARENHRRDALLLLGTMLHSMAVASLLARDSEDRLRRYQSSGGEQADGASASFQSLGLVTDLEPFLRELTDAASWRRR